MKAASVILSCACLPLCPSLPLPAIPNRNIPRHSPLSCPAEAGSPQYAALDRMGKVDAFHTAVKAVDDALKQAEAAAKVGGGDLT